MKLNRSFWAMPALLSLAMAPGWAAPVADAPFAELKSYDGQNRKPIEAINQMIREAHDAATLAEIETHLLPVFQDPQSTLMAHQEVGKLLRVVGTARSVPVLAPFLLDEKLSDAARYALERNPDPSAGKALRDALGGNVLRAGSGGSLRGFVPSIRLTVGLINSIGDRGDAAAVGLLVRSVGAAAEEVSAAAVAALGKIGTPEAIAILQKQPTPLMAQASLNGANRMQSHAATSKMALAIQRRVMNDKTAPMADRLAATRSVLANDPAGNVALIGQLLRDPDTKMQAIGVRWVREMPSGSNVMALAQSADKLPPGAQSLLIGALADRGDKAVLPTVLRAAASTDAGVRLAALRGLATLPGDATAVNLLARSAARATEPAEKEAARASLASMPGAAVDAALLAAIGKAEPDVRGELVVGLGGRYSSAAKPMLFQMASGTDPTMQNAAISALGELAAAEDYPSVVKLLVGTQNATVRGGAENLALRLSKQMPADADRTSALIAGLNGAPLDTRISLLKVLGGVGGPAALEALRMGAKNPDAKIQDTAVRALAASSDAAAMPDLLAIAKNSPLKVHQILALRGYLRLADAQPIDANAFQRYQPAIALASRGEEKKLIISGLSKINTAESLSAITTMMEDKSLSGEAALAAIGIARNIAAANPKDARNALNKVVTGVKDEAVLKQANDVLKTIPAT